MKYLLGFAMNELVNSLRTVRNAIHNTRLAVGFTTTYLLGFVWEKYISHNKQTTPHPHTPLIFDQEEG
jgi:hypothetical protein